MSDTSAVELSSLYKSVERFLPKVRQRRKKTFWSILQKAGVASPSASDRYLDTNSERTNLNDQSNTSLTIFQSPDGNKLIRPLRRRTSNVFARILKDGGDAGGSRSSTNTAELSVSSSDSDHSNEILNKDFAPREPFLRPRAKVKAFSRAQVLSFANAFGSPEEKRRGASRANSTESSGSTESPLLPARNFSFKDRMPKRNSARWRVVLENILNPADRPHSNKIIDSKLSSGQDDFHSSATQSRSQEKKSQKSKLIYENKLASNLSKNDSFEGHRTDGGNSSSKRARRETGDQPDGYGNISGQDIGSFRPSVTSKLRNTSQPDKENHFGKIRKGVVRNSNSYVNNYEVIESNALGSQNNLEFDKRAVSVEKSDDNIKKLPGLRSLSEINELSTSENKRAAATNPGSRALRTHGKVSDNNENSSSDLTFDSDVVLHSTLRNTPVSKPHKGTVIRDGEFLVPRNLMYEGDGGRRRRSSSGNLSRFEVIAESGSLYDAKRDRSEKKQVSEPYLGSDEVRSRNYSERTDASKVKYQTGNEFTGIKRKLESQQTADGNLLSKIKPGTRSQMSDTSRVLDISKGVLSNVSESKRKLTDASNHDKINVPTPRGDDGEPESPVLNFDKGKRNSEPKKSNESLTTTKLIRSRGTETILDVSQPSVSSRVADNSERISSAVSESKRRSKGLSKRDKINVPAITDNELESLIYKFDKIERNSELKKSNENLPTKQRRVNETILGVSGQSAPSLASNNSGRVLPDVSGSKRRPEETLKRGEISRRSDGNSNGNSKPESSLFNFVKLQQHSKQKKSIENLPTHKLTRSQASETILGVNRRSISSLASNNSGRVLPDVSGSKRRLRETSKSDETFRHEDGSDSEPESSLFNFVELKQVPVPKKSNENLPVKELTRSLLHVTIRREADSPLERLRETGTKSRKFLVRGNIVPFKKPAEWVNNRFYNKLMPFFEKKFGPLRCFSACEDAAVELHNNVKKALQKADQRVVCVNRVRKILYDVGVIKTPMDFMVYAEQYLPNEFILIAIPKQVGSFVMGVPYPKGVGLFDDLKLS